MKSEPFNLLWWETVNRFNFLLTERHKCLFTHLVLLFLKFWIKYHVNAWSMVNNIIRKIQEFREKWKFKISRRNRRILVFLHWAKNRKKSALSVVSKGKKSTAFIHIYQVFCSGGPIVYFIEGNEDINGGFAFSRVP